MGVNQDDTFLEFASNAWLDSTWMKIHNVKIEVYAKFLNNLPINASN